MRKIVLTLAILVAFLILVGAAWIFAGRQVSLFLDKFGAVEARSERIRSVRYEGNGAGGVLYVNQIALTLNDVVSPLQPPSIGSTKDGQLALAAGGKVFAFGPMPNQVDAISESLATSPPAGDEAWISIRHSAIDWPTPLDFNFMTGSAPSWKRYQYYRVRWTKRTGANLHLSWRYEQYFYSNHGWSDALMTRGESTGLIRIDIQQ